MHEGDDAVEGRGDGHLLALAALDLEGVLKRVGALLVGDVLQLDALFDGLHAAPLLDDLGLGEVAELVEPFVVLELLARGLEFELDGGAHREAGPVGGVFALDALDLEVEVAGVELGEEVALLHQQAGVQDAAQHAAADLALQLHLVFGEDGDAAGHGVDGAPAADRLHEGDGAGEMQPGRRRGGEEREDEDDLGGRMEAGFSGHWT